MGGRHGPALLPVVLCCAKEELVPCKFLSLDREEVALVSKKGELDVMITKRVTSMENATSNSKKAATAAM